MKLTGKAKEDFLKWYYYNNYHHQVFIETSDDIFINALIIEWFDSVGIYIETFNEFEEFGFLIHKGNFKNPIYDEGHWKSRQEATEKAIQKANEIYNNVK